MIRGSLNDTINHLVDVLGCTRYQAKRIILAARKEGREQGWIK